MIKISCPHCGQGYDCDDEFNGETITCQKCSKEFEILSKDKPIHTPEQPKNIEQQHQHPSAHQEQETLTKCPFCFAEIPSGAKKCSHCGEWIKGSKPINRAIYVLLAFFFGNWGLAEAYLGRYFICGGMVIANIFCLTQIHRGGLYCIAALWAGWFLKALCTNVETRKMYTAARIVFAILLGIFFIALCGMALTVFLFLRK